MFDNLKNFLLHKEPKEYPEAFDHVEFPLFVTWTKQGSLRGCIGTFGFDKLGVTLQRYSLIAAVQDRRFRPMTEADLNHELRVEISLLSDFEQISDPMDWDPTGKHGIEIEFKGPLGSPVENKTFRGTYLPNVMPDQGWD